MPLMLKTCSRSGTVCGERLAEGLSESERLPQAIFTPSTKNDAGHDQNISYDELTRVIGEDAANAAKLRSLALYDYGRIVAEERGIIIADTKFEFGIWNEEVILIDECMTPDSSRFWPLDGYTPGGPQPSFDKQPVRDWVVASGWKDGDPPPRLPAEVAAATTERYLTAYRMLTGQELPS